MTPKKEIAAATAVRRNHTRLVKRGLGVLFVLAVLAMLVYAWMPKPIAVDVAKAERGTLTVTVDEDAQTRVTDRYVVSTPLTGNLERIHIDPGDPVEAGDVIARVDPLEAPLLDPRSRAQAEARLAAAQSAARQARAAVGRVRAALELAQDEAEIQRRLADEGAVAERVAERAELEARQLREELASTQFAAQVAENEVEVARAALGRYERRPTPKPAGEGEESEVMELRAPVSGVVLRVIREQGGAVQTGEQLLEIGNPSSLEIVTDVLTSDAVEIEPGDQVRIERWGGEPLEGRVRLVEPSGFTKMSALGVEEQRVNVIVDLTSPREEWDELGDAYRVETSIVVWQEDDVLTVPASAVFRHDGDWAVYRVVRGNAELSPVEVGRRTGLRVQVLEGVSEGEEVVVHPSDRVHDGVRVEPR